MTLKQHFMRNNGMTFCQAEKNRIEERRGIESVGAKELE
jgi:hypothetical protein